MDIRSAIHALVMAAKKLLSSERVDQTIAAALDVIAGTTLELEAWYRQRGIQRVTSLWVLGIAGEWGETYRMRRKDSDALMGLLQRHLALATSCFDPFAERELAQSVQFAWEFEIYELPESWTDARLAATVNLLLRVAQHAREQAVARS